MPQGNQLHGKGCGCATWCHACPQQDAAGPHQPVVRFRGRPWMRTTGGSRCASFFHAGVFHLHGGLPAPGHGEKKAWGVEQEGSIVPPWQLQRAGQLSAVWHRRLERQGQASTRCRKLEGMLAAAPRSSTRRCMVSRSPQLSASSARAASARSSASWCLPRCLRLMDSRSHHSPRRVGQQQPPAASRSIRQAHWLRCRSRWHGPLGLELLLLNLDHQNTTPSSPNRPPPLSQLDPPSSMSSRCTASLYRFCRSSRSTPMLAMMQYTSPAARGRLWVRGGQQCWCSGGGRAHGSRALTRMKPAQEAGAVARLQAGAARAGGGSHAGHASRPRHRRAHRPKTGRE